MADDNSSGGGPLSGLPTSVSLSGVSETIEDTAEATLDNDMVSLQETTQRGAKRLLFADEVQGDPAKKVSDERLAETIQEGTIETRETLAEVPQQLGEGTPLDSAYGRFLGSSVGAAFDAIVTDPLRSAAKGFTGIDPLGKRKTFASGENQPDRAEAVDPSTEEQFTGTDAFNVATTGTALAAGGLAAKYGLRGLSSAAAKGASKTMGITSLIDEASALSRSADEGVAVTDEMLANPAAQEAGQLAGMSFDEFASVDSTIGSSDEATQATTTADEVQFEQNLQSGIDEAIDALESPRPANTQFGPRAAFEADTKLGFADDAITFADESGSSGAGRSIRNLFGVGDGATATDEAVGSLDDVAASVDEQANAGGAARASESAAEAGRSGSESGGLLSRFTGKQKAAAGLAAGGILGGLGAIAGGFSASDVPRNAGPYERADVYQVNGQQGVLIQITPDVGSQGYSVLLPGASPPLSVLSSSGNAVGANISLQELRDGQPGLEVRFSTRQTARRTFQEWANSQGSQGSGRSASWDGTLSGPGTVRRGSRLQAEAVVRNSSQQEASASFVLALETQGDSQPAALDRQRTSVGPSEQVTLSFSASTRSIQPGEYTLALYAADGDAPGKIASTSLTVEGSDSPDSPDERTRWGDATRLRDLGGGWTLYALRSRDGSERGFVVAGTRGDGTRLYLGPGGRVQQSSHVFETRSDAISAFQTYAQRAQGGNVPDENTPSEASQSPSPEAVRRDAARAEEGTGSGILAAMRANPLYAVGGVAILGGAVYYISGGKPLKWLQNKTEAVLGTGGS